MTYVIRTASDPLGALPAIRNSLRAVDKDQPATSIGLMTDTLNAATAEPGFYARLLATFALLAVVLSLVGTYGVIAYSVAQRYQEIGLRMALGTSGVVIGTIAAWLLTRLLTTFLFETTPTDPATFTSVAVITLVSALLAGLIPARRATRVNPLVALRHE